MKTILYIILFSIEFCYAQFFPHEASLTASKDSVLSSETFTVTYMLTSIEEGHVYIGVRDGYFETIGKDRWEGEIKTFETKKITFTVKLKEGYIKEWIEEKYPLTVGFSYKPFEEKILGWGDFTSIIIKIIDFKEVKLNQKRIKEENDSSKTINKTNNINIFPLPIEKIPGGKKYIKDPNSPKLEYLRNINSNNNLSEIYNSSESFESYKDDLYMNHMKKEIINSTSSTLAYTLNFWASSLTFRNPSNQQLPWQYYFMAVTN